MPATLTNQLAAHSTTCGAPRRLPAPERYRFRRTASLPKPTTDVPRMRLGGHAASKVFDCSNCMEVAVRAWRDVVNFSKLDVTDHHQHACAVRHVPTHAVKTSGDVRLPDYVKKTLSLRPKFATEPKKWAPELISIARRVASAAPNSDEDMWNQLVYPAPVLLRTALQVFEQTTDAGHIVPRDTKQPGTASKMAKGHFAGRLDTEYDVVLLDCMQLTLRFLRLQGGLQNSQTQESRCSQHFRRVSWVPAASEKEREKRRVSEKTRGSCASSCAKRRAVESQLETPSLPLNGLLPVDVDSQELSLMDCSATELQLPLENGASERCITATVQVDRAVQVSSLFSVSAMDKRKCRRKQRDLNARIERLKDSVDKYKQELQKLKEECYVSAFLQVVEKAKEKDLAASILVEQVQNFAKKKPTWVWGDSAVWWRAREIEGTGHGRLDHRRAPV
ncbi:hypothetical protein HPB52_021482 [Rhipicephalus sanguineus]|uniref:Uncharacterized protein n=1 Tax=Rhipicephalus sanguineus TaxID=34632 RepID=A0A9D4QFM0_RHISA|nr:hypothetical protein HPB52_021482 [Rhipicephalus sanguineus]